jgi:pimeloyl-ACP methyl ester carboxylesterase
VTGTELRLSLDRGTGRETGVKRIAVYGAFVILALGVLGSAVVFASFRRDLEAARERLASIPTDTYNSQYGNIQYRLADGAGPVVLIAHGVTGGVDHGVLLTDEFRAFPDNDYRFLYVSRFGYLESALPEDASARTQAAAYKELIDHLGIERIFILGSSAGGPSAAWFAIDYPERTQGLILHSAAGPVGHVETAPRMLFQYDFVFWAAVKAFPEKIMGFLVPDNILSRMTEEEKDYFLRNAFYASLPVTERSEGIWFDNEVSTPSANELPFEEIRTRTLILQAIDDPTEKKAGSEMARRISDSIYVQLTGGHLLVREGDRVRSAIGSFIEN